MPRHGAPPSLADAIYRQLKEDIFEFRLLPGDRFSEGEVAERMAASRTPVRQALYRLQREGQVQVLQPAMQERMRDGDVVFVRESLF